MRISIFDNSNKKKNKRKMINNNNLKYLINLENKKISF